MGGHVWRQGLPPVSGVTVSMLESPSAPPTTPVPIESGGEGLNGGEIAGIVIGSLVGAANLQSVPAFESPLPSMLATQCGNGFQGIGFS